MIDNSSQNENTVYVPFQHFALIERQMLVNELNQIYGFIIGHEGKEKAAKDFPLFKRFMDVVNK